MKRRELFARLRGGPPQNRPPWSRSEAEFTERCVQCAACVEACPEGLIEAGHAGYPIINFERGGCTFCGDCAAACDANCFHKADGRPSWMLRARIVGSCVEANGIVCRMCEETCPNGAIMFRPAKGGSSHAVVEEERCVGCGNCVAVCPVKAISVSPRKHKGIGAGA